MIARVTRLGTDEPQLPISLALAKAHLHKTQDDEDELIQMYLEAAVEWAEDQMNRAVTRRRYRVARRRFPGGTSARPGSPSPG